MHNVGVSVGGVCRDPVWDRFYFEEFIVMWLSRVWCVSCFVALHVARSYLRTPRKRRPRGWERWEGEVLSFNVRDVSSGLRLDKKTQGWMLAEANRPSFGPYFGQWPKETNNEIKDEGMQKP
ncbi:unnamed protein product [Ectocarpus fasciculatus]